jgi:hypothetical protein
MKLIPRRLALVLALAALIVQLPLLGQAPPADQPAAKRAIELEDIIAWRTIGATALSHDGQWFAYRIAPGEGDAQVVVRGTQAGGKEWKFDIGDPQAGAPAAGAPGGGPPAGAPTSAVSFSNDSKYLAFTSYPSKREAERLRRQRRPVQSGVTVVNLANGEKRDYPKIRRFAFSGDAATWIALQRHPAQAPGGAGGGGAAAAGGGRGGAGAAAGGETPSDRPRGTDLILRELSTGNELNVGNVADFAFTDDGRLLAITIDATDKAGNGIQVRDMSSGTVRVLDSAAASYERPTWTEKGHALAVLKGTEDRAYRDKLYSVLGFTGFDAGTPKKVAYDPASDKSFPQGMTISSNRNPQWTDDLQALLFGIHIPRARDASADGSATEGEEGRRPGPAADDQRPAESEAPNADEKVDLVLWHWQDSRLQSQQEVQEGRDRAFNYLAEYRVQP